MSDAITLEAQPRTITGKKVKNLRAEKLIPAVIYGPTVESPVAIQIVQDDLRDVLRTAGGTNVIEIHVGDNVYSVLTREVQRDVLRNNPLHVDFYAADLNVKTTADVRISLVGESEVVTNGEAMLITPVDILTVECLPANIPQELVLDISGLVEIGDYLTVADVQVPEGVEIMDDDDRIVIRAEIATREEEEEETEEDELEAVDAGEVEVIKRGKEEEEEEE